MNRLDRLDNLFRPHGIAVIGASNDPTKWGSRVVRQTVELAHRGPIWAINSKNEIDIAGSRYASNLEDVTDDVDLVVAAVPQAATLEVVRACVKNGIPNIVLPAAGFSETGEEGAAEEQQIREIALAAGMRVLGPNCFGLYSHSGAFNATPFTPIPGGDIGLVSQSGNVAAHAFIAAQQRALGFSRVVGLGNQLDISVSDVVAWLADDVDTKRVALYIEGLRDVDASAFISALERCRNAGKPVVVVKAGGSDAGRAVALSHTGSLASEDRVWEEALKGSGAIRVHSVEQMFGVLALSGLPTPPNRRIVVMTDGGGDSIMAVDAAERHGLMLARLPATTQTDLDHIIPPAAPRIDGGNPITLDTAGGVEDDPEILARCLDVLGDVPDVDAVVVGGLFGTYEHVREAEMLAVTRIVSHVRRGRPVIVHSPVPAPSSEPLQTLQLAGVPVFSDMDPLLRAVSAWMPQAPVTRGSRSGPVGVPGGGTGRQWDAADASRVLRDAGVAMPPMAVIDGLEGLKLSEEIGFPICIKTADPGVVHKSDVGGVRVDIKTPGELLAAARDMTHSTGSDRLLLMPSLPAGLEIMIGARTSPQFGPVVVVGRGGIWAEVEADTATFVGDVIESQFLEAISRLRFAPMLFGGRGRPQLDTVSLFPLVRSLIEVTRAHPGVSLDLNPVFLYQDGYGVADFRLVDGM